MLQAADGLDAEDQLGGDGGLAWAELVGGEVAAVLVGEALMRAPDPERAVRALRAGASGAAELTRGARGAL